MDPQAGQDPTDGNDGQDPIAKPDAGKATAQQDKDTDTPQAGDDVSKKVKRANDEAAKARVELREAREALQKLQDSLKSEDEKKADRLKQLEKEAGTWRDRERVLNKENSIVLAAAKADTNDPDVLALLLNQRSLEYDDETGKATTESLSEAIAAILEEKPYLVKAQAAATPTTTPKATSAGAGINVARKDAGVFTKESIDKMSIDEINAAFNSGELSKLLAAGGVK